MGLGVRVVGGEGRMDVDNIGAKKGTRGKVFYN